MTAIEFIQSMVAELHGAMFNDVKVLTQEHLAWKPAPKANPIAFLFWHCMRAEDNIVHGLLGKPPIWESEQWYEKLGIDAKARIGGFQEPEIDEVAALPLFELISYAERVTTSTEDYLRSLDDAGLDYPPDPDRPRRTIGMMIRNFILAHGWWHLGEIKYIKGMQGMPQPR